MSMKKQIVTLLCTPTELDAMAVGFLLSEGILKDPESLLDVQVNEKTFTVSATLADLPDDIDATFHKKNHHFRMRARHNLHRCLEP